ncbi:MAG: lactoylglutathione lyase [Hellea sp.]|nr:lactoylglutathione lyase [Hellea sp.]
MEYLHTMIRISDVDASLKFFVDGLGFQELRRVDNEKGKFTLIFLATPDDLKRSGLKGDEYPLPSGLPMIELTHNWDEAGYSEGRNFGHMAFRVDNVYEICQRLSDMGYAINRPPRDGYMAFVRSPDNISIELLQKGDRLEPAEPWASMENSGKW